MNAEERRIWQMRLMVKSLGKLISGGPEAAFVRAGGDARCPVCGLPFFDHPVCSDGLLVVSCQGELLKL